MDMRLGGRAADGRFYVNGVDVSGAPELRGLGWRRFASVAATAVVVGLAATWWIGASIGWAILLILACGTIAFPVSFIAFVVPELMTVRRIERRYRLEGRTQE